MPEGSLLASILSLAVFRRALIALLFSGLAYPAMGTFILSLELVPARFAIMHVSLLGAALGLILGIDPTFAALAMALLAGLGLAAATERGGSTGNSAGGALGLVMALSLSIAFIIFHKGGVRALEAFNLLWGNVLALRPPDVVLTVATAILVLGFTLLFFKEIRAILLDRELARSSGMPARPLYFALMILLCLGMGMAMRLTGALLADALTILPALAARNLRRGFRATLLAGSAFGLLSNAAGFALALAFDIPTGPAIIIAASALVGATAAAGAVRRRHGRTDA